MLALVVACWLFARQLISLVSRRPLGASHSVSMETSSGSENSIISTVEEICDTDTVQSVARQQNNWENAEYEIGQKTVYVINAHDDEDDGWLGDHNDEIDETCSPNVSCIPLPYFCEGELISDLKKRWLDGNREVSDDQRADLRAAIETSCDPYDFLLVLVKRTYKMSQGVKSLSRVAMQEMQSWCKTLAAGERPKLTVTHKLMAVSVGIECSPTLFELIRSVFELCCEDPSIYVPYVRDAIRSGCFKEAATCVAMLHMQPLFSVREILLPLVLIDRPAVIERYLDGNKDVQKSFLQMVDDLCSSDTDLLEACRSVGVTNTKVTKKQLHKMAGRISQVYNLNFANCRNLVMSKNERLLRGFLFKKYVQKKPGNWNELMEGCVRDSTELQYQLVRELVHHGDVATAAQHARTFGLVTSQLPSTVQSELWRHPKSPATGQCRRFESTSRSSMCAADFYQLPLPFSSVFFIDNVCDFQLCMAAILQPNSVVGVDSEWRPMVSRTGHMDLGLLQLATQNAIFLLDMAALPQLVPDAMFIEFAERLFASEEVLTLGYAIGGDLEVLALACPCMRDALTRPQRVIDLMPFAQTVERLELEVARRAPMNNNSLHHSEAANPDETTGRGLSKLVQKYCGNPLDKSNQLSDWGRRPLRRDQIVYAASDAYCLLDVYQAMKQQALRLAAILHVDVDVEPEMPLMKWVQPKRANTFRISQPKSIVNPPPLSGPPLNPRQLHVVVDSMLGGLGRQLQCCGVDVRVLSSSEDHSQAAKVSRKENRIILTAGNPFHALCLQVPVGFCYCVMSGRARDQVVEVLKHFNVRVTERDIFSRCQVCNNDVYVRLAATDMETILKLCHPDKFTQLDESQANSVEPWSDGPGDSSLPADEIPVVWLGKGLTVRDGAAFIDPSGIRLVLDMVPIAMVGCGQWFFCCTKCGKVFWQGKHFQRVREQFGHVISQDT